MYAVYQKEWWEKTDLDTVADSGSSYDFSTYACVCTLHVLAQLTLEQLDELYDRICDLRVYSS
jgi:hypothetical protein